MLDGGGDGNVITVTAPDVTVRGVTVRGSGRDLQAMNSGIFLQKTAERATIENNRLVGNLFGVYVHGAAGSRVARNVIEGLRGHRLSEAGNGVSLWNAPDVTIADNTFRYGRDGIFTISSRKDRFVGNRFEQVRFAVHYMYTNDSEVSGNVSVGNHVGYAIMYSNRLVIRDNISDRDRDHGILFNYANYADIDGNRVTGGPLDTVADSGEERPDDERGMIPDAKREQGLRSGPEKCVFIYNTNHNRFRNNWFERCAIGVHFTAGSEGNEITGNAFVGNRNQVKYVGTRNLDWSKGGRGNYWSDNPAFDLNGDGIADTAYRPNDLVDRVLWTAPSAKVLINSPAVQVLRWAQAQFPALYPGGVVDSHPLIAPPPRPTGKEVGKMTPTVSIAGVVKNYRAVRALRDVSFDLAPGRLSALVGHNGAGKTTLIKLMLGLIRPDSGSIRVLDEDPAAGEFSARRQLGYLPENVAFNAALTGRETLTFYARLKHVKPSKAWAFLDRVGLTDAADRRVGTYSKGMRQRLGLAQALLGRPRVLLLDEPTTGLDPALRQTFYEILNELRDDGATVLISSHALNELEDRAEHVLIMNRGLLVAQGTLSELRSISQLPIRVSLDFAPGATVPAAWMNGASVATPRGRILLVPDEARKMDVLRAAAGDPNVTNIEIAAPTLDELYAHFLNSQESAA